MRRATVRWLRRAAARASGSSPVLIPEYPLQIRSRWGWDKPELAPVASLLAGAESEYESMVDDVCSLGEWAATLPRTEGTLGQPAWENDYWGTLDALAQCSALRKRNPELYVEIGSGWSTLFARRAIDDFGLRTKIVSIDPSPRAEVDASCDEVIRQRLEDVDVALFDRLGPGDILLFDGSHTALMNSDATVVFLEVMPRLERGVLLGIDDVFLPWDYHPTWVSRIYGEQYLLAAFLLGGAAGWTVRFPAWWLVEHSALNARFEPLWPIVENRFGRHAASFWMEKSR
jgi:hypothetical protein